jgi:hypothetical protein
MSPILLTIIPFFLYYCTIVLLYSIATVYYKNIN